MKLVMNDGLPRNIAYPIKGSTLEEALLQVEEEVGEIGLYFLYISGVQLDYYDALTSKVKRYPVLVLDRTPPPLNTDVTTRLLQQQIAQDHRTSALRDPKRPLSGTALAEAQLRKEETGGEEEEPVPELELPDISLLVVPVKTRFRTKIGNLIETQGMQAIKNWLSCKPEMQANQRPLVLTYDEAMPCSFTSQGPTASRRAQRPVRMKTTSPPVTRKPARFSQASSSFSPSGGG